MTLPSHPSFSADSHPRHAVVARNLRLIHELGGLCDGLHAEGVDVLTLKGPVLAALAYPDIGSRACVDLDILIPSLGEGEVVRKKLRTERLAVGQGFPRH